MSKTEGNSYQSTLTIAAIAFGDAGNYFYEVNYAAGDNFQGGSLETEYTQVVVYGESQQSDLILLHFFRFSLCHHMLFVICPKLSDLPMQIIVILDNSKV